MNDWCSRGALLRPVSGPLYVRMACSKMVGSYARFLLGLRVGLYYGRLRADYLGGRYAHQDSP